MAAIGGLTLLQGLSLAGTAMQALGSIQEGAAAKSAAKFDAQVANRNAETVKQQTKAAMETQDRERRQRRGSAIANAGASGVGIESFGDVLSSSAQQEKLDLLTLESEGLLRQRDFETEAAMKKASGSNAMKQGIFGAASSILGGASKIGGGQKASSPSFGPFRDKRNFV